MTSDRTTTAQGAVATSTAGTSTAVATPAKALSKSELREAASLARAELASTLDAIETKLNVPKRIRINVRSLRLRLSRLGDDNPLALAGIAVGALTVVVAAVLLGVKAVRAR